MLHAPLFTQRKLVRVFANAANGRIELTHHLRTKQTKTAVAEHRDVRPTFNRDLSENLISRSEWFGEHRRIVVNIVRHFI